MTLTVHDVTHSCNTIAEAFLYKTKEYNGCVITLRLSNKNVDEIDSFYHLVYYARSNYKLVLGALNQKLFFSDAENFSFLCYHDSAWRYDSYRDLQSEFKKGNYSKISIEEITPIHWDQITCSIPSNSDCSFNVYIERANGSISRKLYHETNH